MLTSLSSTKTGLERFLHVRYFILKSLTMSDSKLSNLFVPLSKLRNILATYLVMINGSSAFRPA